MNELGYVMDDKLCITGVIDNRPNIVRQGGTPPANAYSTISLATRGYYRIPFRCPFCHQDVLMFAAPNASIVQVCLCILVAHLHPDQFPPYTTSEDWTEFQVLYELEKRDPALPEYLRKDPYSAGGRSFSPKGLRWMRRKFKLPDEATINPEGTVLFVKGAGSLHVNTKDGSVHALSDDPEKLIDTICELRARNEAGPASAAMHTVIVGDDPDYIWPPPADTTRIEPAPFRCPRCKARVKHAPIPGCLEVDRVYGCLCMIVILRREAPSPRSSVDWGELRLKVDTHTVRHKATVADASS